MPMPTCAATEIARQKSVAMTKAATRRRGQRIGQCAMLRRRRRDFIQSAGSACGWQQPQDRALNKFGKCIVIFLPLIWRTLSTAVLRRGPGESRGFLMLLNRDEEVASEEISVKVSERRSG